MSPRRKAGFRKDAECHPDRAIPTSCTRALKRNELLVVGAISIFRREPLPSLARVTPVAFKLTWPAILSTLKPNRYKLLTRDMGPHTRCAGTDVPPPLDFQLPLADTPAELPSYTRAKWAIKRVLERDPSYSAMFVTLAYQCASTFRTTDYIGGCNGARIRFPPQIDWASNAGLGTVSIITLR